MLGVLEAEASDHGQKRRAVFLDRDGVLTAAVVDAEGKPSSPSVASEMEIYPEAAPACRRLAEAGLMRICVTNQPEIARGHLDPGELQKMNERLQSELGLDEVIFCPCDDGDDCTCKKPKPGMTLDAAERYGIDLAQSFTIGDRWRDIDSGNAAGTRTVFIDRGYAEKLRTQPEVTVDGIAAAADWILERSQTSLTN